METVDRLADVVELLSGHEDLFVRYSRGPDADRHESSRDYESGLDLPGLAVADLAAVVVDPAHDGPDHEPLIADAKPVARIGRRALAEAAEHYERHFDVGRDSKPES